jgi:prolyl oligopeptidase
VLNRSRVALGVLTLALLAILIVPQVGVHSVFARPAAVSAPPPAPKQPVTDTYQGVKVTDDYRWLENWDDPAVKQWSAAENARTRNYLDHLASRPIIRKQLEQMYSGDSARYFELQYCAGTLFAMKMQAPKQQPMLVARPADADLSQEHMVVDPNAMSGKGAIAIDFYAPSLDGKMVAVSLSENGSEQGDAHVFDAASGKELSDRVPRVNGATAGGSIAWKADNSGFYYTRYPQGNEFPKADLDFYQQVYFHKLGTDAREDTYVIGKDFPRIAEIQLHTDDEGRYLLVTVANGDGGQFAHYLMDTSGHWTQVTKFDDAVVGSAFGEKKYLYLLSRQNAPRGEVLRLSLSEPQLSKAETVVAQSPPKDSSGSPGVSIDSITAAGARLYVTDMAGGPTQTRVFDDQGKQLGKLAQPEVSAINHVVPVNGDNTLFSVSTYLAPTAWYTYDAGSGQATRNAMSTATPVTFGDAEAAREFATSQDGTRVPVNIIHRRGIKLDGSNPTLLIGYGGYGISMTPGFLGPFGRVWLDAGGIYVVANLRGGAEYGEAWHHAGNLTRKQNVFDDFAAAAQHLIDRKYTSPAHLAILGGSNGGLLMGAAFTQHPELYRAVVSFVGIYDMLRVEHDSNGAFNVTEFGSTKDPAQFKALYAYSPYHHVNDGTRYPAILMLTGENDGRVSPYHSRKMLARLQAANTGPNPILLRTSSNSGHGIGTALNEALEQDADVFSFLFDQLGIDYQRNGKL